VVLSAYTLFLPGIWPTTNLPYLVKALPVGINLMPSLINLADIHLAVADCISPEPL